MFDLNPEILAEFVRLKNESCTFSQIMRHIFSKYGEISPPRMAYYFKKIYGFQASDFLPALASWWPDSSSDISDSEFDRRICAAIEFAAHEEAMCQVKRISAAKLKGAASQ